MSAIDILRWLGETSLAVGLLILLILLIRRPVAKMFGAEAAYALWLAPVIRLFLPELAILPKPSPSAAEPIEFTYVREAFATSANAPTSVDLIAFIAAAALLIWIMVAVALAYVRFEAQSRVLNKIFKTSKLASISLQKEAKEVAKELGLRKKFLLRVCDKEHGPSIFGFFRPVIFLPAGFETDYSRHERQLALAHELAHIKRGDMMVVLLASIFQAVQWLNPLVHFAMRAFRTDQESACDSFVLNRQRRNKNATSDYASAILKSARHWGSHPAYGLSLGHPVKERLMLLTNQKHSAWRQLSGGVAVVALTAAGLAGTASYGFAADKDNEKTEIVEERNVVAITDEDSKKIERRVVVFSGEGGDEIDHEMEVLVLGEGDARIMKDGMRRHHKVMEFSGKEGGAYFISDCTAGDDINTPVKLEWKDEEGDENDKRISHTVICLTGDETSDDPKAHAKALRKAIDRMEENAKKEEARRKKMIDGLRKELRELEKKK